MDNKSKNGLDLIRISAKKVNGNWGKAFLATLIYVSPLILFCAIPYAGWAISFALFGYLTLGYINYMQQLLGGKNPSLKVLFVQPEYAQAILLGIIMAVGVTVGLVLFIIPGVMVIAYYSFSLFVLNEERIVNVTDTLNVTARQMNGHKTAMFAYKVIFYFGYALVGAASIIGMMFIIELCATKLALGIVLAIALVLAAIVLISIITIYLYAANVVFYDEIIRTTVVENYTLKSEAKLAQSKAEETVETEEPANVEEPADTEEKVEEEVKEEKPEPKKTSTRKTTTKKTTK